MNWKFKFNFYLHIYISHLRDLSAPKNYNDLLTLRPVFSKLLNSQISGFGARCLIYHHISKLTSLLALIKICWEYPLRITATYCGHIFSSFANDYWWPFAKTTSLFFHFPIFILRRATFGRKSSVYHQWYSDFVKDY